jgi:hypothetical protein
MQKDTEALDKIGRSIRFYAALGLVTAATLMLQIIETRIISVTSWYHLAFFVISIAMFGLTAGAIFVYLRKERFRPERLSYDLAVATLAFAFERPARFRADFTFCALETDWLAGHIRFELANPGPDQLIGFA